MDTYRDTEKARDERGYSTLKISLLSNSGDESMNAGTTVNDDGIQTDFGEREPKLEWHGNRTGKSWTTLFFTTTFFGFRKTTIKRTRQYASPSGVCCEGRWACHPSFAKG